MSDAKVARSREDFIRAVYTAHVALAAVRAHARAGPGIKGLQEELLDLCEVDFAEMMRVVHPGWPARRAGTTAPPASNP